MLSVGEPVASNVLPLTLVGEVAPGGVSITVVVPVLIDSVSVLASESPVTSGGSVALTVPAAANVPSGLMIAAADSELPVIDKAIPLAELE